MISGHSKGRGYALVLVLWVLAILTFLSGFAFSSARTETRLARGDLALLQGKALGDAGIWIAIKSGINTRAKGGATPSTRQETVFLGDEPVTIDMRDVAGKININYAPRELLIRLLESTSLSKAAADELGYFIADWIDADSDSVADVNEATPYRRAGLDYTPANRPFATLNELRLVAGLSDEVFREIEPFLTTYGSHEYLNREAADPELLGRLASVDSDDTSWEARFLASGSSNVFEISSTADVAGSTVESKAIVEFLPAGSQGFLILAWNE